MSPVPAPPQSLWSDFLILGSGVAGLRAAIELAPRGTVLIVNKGLTIQSATGFAQGGIAVATQPEDSWELHLADTLRTGQGLCRRESVETLVKDGPVRFRELVAWGGRFDRKGDQYATAKEGAHSLPRILHAGGDATGSEILRTLSNKAASFDSVTQWENCISLDLLVHDGTCLGAVVQREGQSAPTVIGAKGVLMATGGAGQLFSRTTNPAGASGDGMAMAFRAGANLTDMEFVQFHPTALHLKGAPSLLLSEAMRGEGARLLNHKGERFMSRYHPDAELAPRDVASRAILEEIRVSGKDHVYLDITHFSSAYLKGRFPTIHRTCASYGLDIGRDPIPISPSAHFMIGGVETDLEGRTSIPGLYAAGEVSANGVHGANRLASNSLLEGLVFGARAGAALAKQDPPGIFRSPSLDRVFLEDASLKRGPRRSDATQDREIRRGLADLMWKKAGIVRTESELLEALDALGRWEEELSSGSAPVESVEVENLLTVAKLIARGALERKESRGVHYRSDYPDEVDEWKGRHIRFSIPDGMKSTVAT